VGIGGIGMSGIAELLANLGFEVSGSDAKRSAVTERLTTLGIRVDLGHDAAQIGDADVVVISSAVRPANPEVVRGRATAGAGDPAGRDARGADAPSLLDRVGRAQARRRDVDDCAGAGAKAHQLREHLGPRDHRHLPSRGLDHLRVGRPHRRRDHHDVGIADLRRVVPRSTRMPSVVSRSSPDRFASVR